MVMVSLLLILGINEVDHDVDDVDDAEAVWCGLL